MNPAIYVVEFEYHKNGIYLRLIDHLRIYDPMKADGKCCEDPNISFWFFFTFLFICLFIRSTRKYIKLSVSHPTRQNVGRDLEAVEFTECNF